MLADRALQTSQPHVLFGNLQDSVNGRKNSLAVSHLTALLHEITSDLYLNQVLGLSIGAVKEWEGKVRKPISFLLSSNTFLKAKHQKQDAWIPTLSFIAFALYPDPEGKSCLQEPRDT